MVLATIIFGLKMRSVFVLVFCLLPVSWCRMDQDWWKYTTMYQVFLPSFKDSNGDGMGDLKGLTSKLDHIANLGVETIYITPHYESPMMYSGYDISNYTAVNSQMGTMEDFETLIKEMNARGLKLVIDLVINHSSDKHPWFTKSINREYPYTDFYVWENPKGYDPNGAPIPPNNWLDIFDTCAWEWNDKRKQFFLHQFTAQQPDFNLRSTAMKTELQNIFKFWLDKGVAGFRLDAAEYLLEDAQRRDEPLIDPNLKAPRNYADLKHIYTRDYGDTYKYIRELRGYLDKEAKKYADYYRGILISETYSTGKALVLYYGTRKHRIVHLPLNFNLVQIKDYKNASFYHNIINSYLHSLPKWATPSWNAENHDRVRKAYVLNEEFEFIFASMVMMLPGMSYLYYGQEIGVTGSKIRQDQDSYNIEDEDQKREWHDTFSRHPMPWDDSLNGGFSTNYDLFLPLNPNYWRINVKSQKEKKDSYYNLFKKVVDIKKTETLKLGNFKSHVISTWVFGISRKLENRESYYAIYNLNSKTEFIDLHNVIDDLPESLTIETGSPNSGYKIGDKVPTKQKNSRILIMNPLSVVLLSDRKF